MYFRDRRSRSTLILVLAHLLHQVRRITASCQAPTSSADITEPFSPGTAAQGRGSAWWCGKDRVGIGWGWCAQEPHTSLCSGLFRVITPILASPGVFLVRRAHYDILAALLLGIPPSLIFLLLPVPLLPRDLSDLGVNPLHAGPAGTVRLRGRAESTAVYLVS